LPYPSNPQHNPTSAQTTHTSAPSPPPRLPFTSYTGPPPRSPPARIPISCPPNASCKTYGTPPILPRRWQHNTPSPTPTASVSGYRGTQGSPSALMSMAAPSSAGRTRSTVVATPTSSRAVGRPTTRLTQNIGLGQKWTSIPAPGRAACSGCSKDGFRSRPQDRGRGR
jgi:hypothetical protein